MSITHSGTVFAPVDRHDLAARHPQLMPFLVGLGIAVVSGVIALAFIGLPA